MVVFLQVRKIKRLRDDLLTVLSINCAAALSLALAGDFFIFALVEA